MFRQPVYQIYTLFCGFILMVTSVLIIFLTFPNAFGKENVIMEVHIWCRSPLFSAVSCINTKMSIWECVMDNPYAALLWCLMRSYLSMQAANNIWHLRISVPKNIHNWYAKKLSQYHCCIFVWCLNKKHFKEVCGVPQGSVLWPDHFTDYSTPIASLIYSFGITAHCYANDSQL